MWQAQPTLLYTVKACPMDWAFWLGLNLAVLLVSLRIMRHINWIKINIKSRVVSTVRVLMMRGKANGVLQESRAS
jgi:hypothetical protein